MLFVKSAIFTISLLLGTQESTSGITDDFWLTNYEQAITEARKEGKPIMLYFSGSDWCKPCIIWKKEVFDTETFQHYANDKLVPVKLDFPRLKKNRLPEDEVNQNESLAKKYNNEGVFPMVVFIKANGSVIEKSPYRDDSAADFIKYVETILAKNN
jgi:thioredoxin-related protein